MSIASCTSASCTPYSSVIEYQRATEEVANDTRAFLVGGLHLPAEKVTPAITMAKHWIDETLIDAYPLGDVLYSASNGDYGPLQQRFAISGPAPPKTPSSARW